LKKGEGEEEMPVDLNLSTWGRVAVVCVGVVALMGLGYLTMPDPEEENKKRKKAYNFENLENFDDEYGLEVTLNLWIIDICSQRMKIFGTLRE
jgi:hypothetical protein